MGEVVHLAAEPVDEHERRTRTFIEIMDAGAVNFDEMAAGRQRLLDPPRGPSRENGEGPGENDNSGQTEAGNPGDNGHFLTPASGGIPLTAR
jgi:hypothetical protein